MNTRAVCQWQSHRRMFPLLSCSFCNVGVASAIFLVYKCNTLNGPNWTPGSFWEGYLWKDCRKLKTFFSTRKIQSLYKQTLRTGHKPRDSVWDPLKRMHVCGKPNGHLESSLLPQRWREQLSNLHLPETIELATLQERVESSNMYF